MNLPRPTALGFKAAAFYAVLTGAFFAAPYANLFFLLVAFLTALGALTLFWTGRALSGVAGKVEDPGPVPAGSPVPIRARVDGGRRFRPAAALVLDVEGAGTVEAGTADLDGETVVRGRLPALPRGIHEIRGAWLVSTWPLGFLRARAPLAAASDLVVYPAPAELPEARGAGGGLAELLGPRASAEGFLQPSGVREYREGDELRRVHWKASARRGELVVTEWDGGGGSGLEVVLDRRADPERLEEALSLLAAIALAAKEEKELVTLHTQGLSLTYGGSHRPREELLRFLAGADFLPAGGDAPPPASPEVLRLPVGGSR